MNVSSKKNFAACVLLLFVAFPVDVFPGEGPYTFPINVDDPSWPSLTYHEKMANGTVPEDILASMSTPDLVVTCMSHPNRSVFIFGFPGKGISSLIKYWNCYGELSRRADSGRSILEYYETLDATLYEESWSKGKQFDFKASFAILELLMGVDSIRATLTEDEKVRILRHCRTRLGPWSFGKLMSDDVVSLLTGKMLVDLNAMPDANDPVRKSIERGGGYPRGYFQKIKELTSEFLAQVDQQGGAK